MWRYLFLLPVYLLSTALPLATSVGANLEYEYALIASYLALLLIPAVAFALPSRYLPIVQGRYAPPVGIETIWIFAISPIFGLLSGAYMFWSGLCPCSSSGFAFWMTYLWYPAWVLAHAVHHAVLRARAGGMKRRTVGLAAVAVYLALLGAAAVELWFAPQKRLSHLLLGFLHGPIYDDEIVVDTGLVLARVAHLAGAATLLFGLWLRRSTPRILSVIACGAIWLVTATLAANHASTRNDKDTLDRLLTGKLAGEGFTLRYHIPENEPRNEQRNEPGRDQSRTEQHARGNDQENETGSAPESEPTTPASHEVATVTERPVPRAVWRLYVDTQFHVSELRALLGETQLPHVHVYVYPDTKKKKLWFGGGATDVTDVRTPSIHITAGSWPHPTLRHELVHALTSGFAFHGLGFHPNMAFTEGLAVALAPSARNLSLDDGAASLIKSNRLPPIADLFSPSFWKVSGSRAYTVAGSFIRYLMDQYGIQGVKALYSGASWQKAFGQERNQLIAAWREHVLAGYDPSKNEIYAEALYRSPGILNDLCPHSKVDLNRDRNENVYVRLRQPLSWDRERDYLPWLLWLNPDDQDVRLRIWRREIRKLAMDRFTAPGRLETWQEALKRARHMPPKSLEDVEMAILESDIARLLDDVAGSVKTLEELNEVAATRYLGDSLTREIQARLLLEKGIAGSQTPEWRRYLAGFRRRLPETTLSSGPWLLTYLNVRNDRDVRLNPDVLRRLMTEAKPDPQLAPTFHVEWYRILANRFMSLQAYEDAALAYEKAADAAPPAARELYVEHARRARFYAGVDHTQAFNTQRRAPDLIPDHDP